MVKFSLISHLILIPYKLMSPTLILMKIKLCHIESWWVFIPDDDLLWGGDKAARRAVYLLDNFWFYLRDKLDRVHDIRSRSQLKQTVDHMRKTVDQYHW